MTAPPTPSPPGLHLTRGAQVRGLADELARWAHDVVTDPFETPLIVTPGPGLQRWLSQHLAQASRDNEGICAGFEFASLGGMARRLSGADPDADPWSHDRLVWGILTMAESGIDGLAVLRDHLDGSDQRVANAARVAALLQRYADHHPALLRAWSRGEMSDALGFDAWQAVLWRALHTVIPGPDPVERHDALVAGLESGAIDVPWPRVAVFAPRSLAAPQVALLSSLAHRVRVDVWVVSSPSHPLHSALGRRATELWALLEHAATTVRELGDPATTPRVQVHASHGPGRQVEVLREALTALLADDPTLEPRDVAVLCPQPAALAPHLTAAFAADALDDGWAHPARTFRVQIAGLEASASNQAAALVRDILELGATRATARDLLALLAHPFVARRFGLRADDLDRLGELVPAASIRWGINRDHRARFALGDIVPNTWQIGVQRLLLGEALADEAGASAGVIAPVDDVESSDVVRVGALAEFVSRVARLVQQCGSRTTASGWVDRFAAIVDALVEAPFEEAWQVRQVHAVLADLRVQAAEAPALLSVHDAIALLDAHFARRGPRPTFGNGSLIVSSLSALAHVPHRVMCLVGLDATSFPRHELADGDDLLGRLEIAGTPDAGSADRHDLFAALLSAEEHVVVVHQGRSSLTNEVHPPAPGLIDLIEFAGPDAVRHEPLQPFAPALFDAAAPRSFDADALAGARALLGERRAEPDRWSVGYLPLADPPAAYDLDLIRQFMVHPAKYFLRRRAQFVPDDATDLPTDLPLELGGLERWQVGDRVLADVLRGLPLPDALSAEWLRGELPPADLGTRVLEQTRSTLEGILGRLDPAWLREAPTSHPVEVSIDGLRLTGRVATRADAVAHVTFSRPRARHLASAWIEALALTVALDRVVEGVVVGAKTRIRLVPPDPEVAQRHLATLLGLAEEGLQRILPLPAETGHTWASRAHQGADPTEGWDLTNAWGCDSDHDTVWPLVFPKPRRPWTATTTDEPWAQPGERSQLGSLARLVWLPLVRAEEA